MTGTEMPGEHFPGCHPEDATDPREMPKGYEPAETEDCWHCGTATPHGCRCWDCLADDDVIPVTAIYHCPTCKRWWAYMLPPRITTITFGAPEAASDQDGAS